jgi:erythromycin esterase-like protein
MQRLARTVVQFEDVRGARPGGTPRDTYMAENALWALRRTGASGRIALWAHNFHVGISVLSAGRVLRDSLGAQYAIVATAFDSGSLTARPGNGTAPPTTIPVPAARAESYEAVLRRVRHPAFVADLRAVPPGIARQWLNGSQYVRNVGALYDAGDNLVSSYSASSLISDFGILAFTRRGTATTLLPFDYGAAP